MTDIWHVINSATGSFPVAGIEVIPAEVYEGWSTVTLIDLTTTRDKQWLFTQEESRLLTAVFEQYAMWADAQLAGYLFPRPANGVNYVDPIPDLLVPRLLVRVIDLVATILRTRELDSHQ